jgi:TPR repeat protein
MTAETAWQSAEATYDAFVRGDAMIGLMPDPQAALEALCADLWQAADAGDTRAYDRLGDVFFAVLVPIGAFDGAYEAASPERCQPETHVIVEEIGALEAALRCHWKAASLGLPDAARRLAVRSRFTHAENQRIAADALERLPALTPAERYQLGLVYHWMGELEAAEGHHRTAAEAGFADAMFELHLYASQGLTGAADPVAAAAWLDRAADQGHARALYNQGAAYASGDRGPVDLAAAAERYQRAAEAGHGRAAATLAVMALTGERDADDAEAWLDRAEAYGYDPAEMLEVVGLPDPRW